MSLRSEYEIIINRLFSRKVEGFSSKDGKVIPEENFIMQH